MHVEFGYASMLIMALSLISLISVSFSLFSDALLLVKNAFQNAGTDKFVGALCSIYSSYYYTAKSKP